MASKLIERCKECEHRDDCDSKRMEECAYLFEPSLVADIAAPMSQSYAVPIMEPHDYRDIKINKSTTITIDIEDVKKRCPLL